MTADQFFESRNNLRARRKGGIRQQVFVVIKIVTNISIGTAEKYRKRAARAVLSLEADSYCWPDDLERRTMSIAIQKKWFFPNCVGFMDGTLLPLEFKPKLHGETYYSWKGFFQSTC